ncbi:MAG: nitric oxide reductase activation protein NorD, partial [Clostridia bacterium]|nr:nitric oxide reductase activation protein NorD [Clostridia bacterium]
MRTSHLAIRKRIENEKLSITDEQLFASPAYAAYLTDLAEAASKRYKRSIKVRTFWDDSDDAAVAWTDNRIIHINTGNSITRSYPTRKLRADSIAGLAGHELGHILYTDFTMLAVYSEALDAGRFYPNVPDELTMDEQDALDEYRQYIADKDKPALAAVAHAAHIISNILEDIYIEARMCDAFPGVYCTGILLNSIRMMEVMPTITDQIDRGDMGFAILCNLLLQYCRSGEVNNLTGYSGVYMEKLVECIPLADDAVYDTDARVRYDCTNRILTGMAEELVEAQMEDELTAELQDEADRIEYGNAHKGIHVTIHRITQPEESLVQSYSRIAPPLLLLSKRIQSRVTDLLKDRRDGGKQTNLLMGRRINARAFAQEDGKVFYNNRLPEESMNLAVALLIDESGSMSSSDRITYARSASIVLYDFCVKLEIPVIVYGHTSYDRDVDMYAYAEFDSHDKKDCCRMMDMSARGGNRDGAALRYVAERLMTRAEETKLLIL